MPDGGILRAKLVLGFGKNDVPKTAIAFKVLLGVGETGFAGQGSVRRIVTTGLKR